MKRGIAYPGEVVPKRRRGAQKKSERVAKRTQADLAKARMDRAMQIIREEIAEPLDVEMLATRVGMTLVSFLDSFRKKFTKTPTRVRDELRVQEVKRFLLRGRPLHVAARNIGISDPSIVVKVFTKLVGKHPNRWLKDFRAKELVKS